jgi:ABC-2 type transport system permease protein
VTRTFAALKWRLVVNGMTRTRHGRLALAGALVGFFLAGIAALEAIATGRGHESALAFRAGGLGTYLIVFGLWTFGPLVIGVDETVDPSRLTLVSLSHADIRKGVVAASLIGFGPVAAAIVIAGVVIGFVRFSLGGLVVVLAAAVGFAMALCASRALATVLVRAQRSRRGRDISVLAAALVGAGLWFGTQMAPHLGSKAETRLFDALRFSPPGLAGQAIVDASRGNVAVALAGIMAAIAWTVLFAWAWVGGVTALLVDPGTVSRDDHRSANDGAAWARGSELHAATRKELRYLARSPARRSVTLVAIVLGTGFVLLQVLQHPGSVPDGIVLVAPLSGLFALSAANNQLGHDGASLWLEVVCGGPRRAEFVARELSWLPALVFPTVPAALLLAAISGGWRYVPFAIGLAFAACGVPFGVGAVLSVFAPILVPDDVNPFLNRQANTGRGCIVGLASLAALTSDALLLLPVTITVVVAHRRGLLALGVVLPAIAVYTFAIWFAAVTFAARRARKRQPELIAAMSPNA